MTNKELQEHRQRLMHKIREAEECKRRESDAQASKVMALQTCRKVSHCEVVRRVDETKWIAVARTESVKCGNAGSEEAKDESDWNRHEAAVQKAAG